VVIDDAGLAVTVGYLITEGMGAEVTAANGKLSRADNVGFDIASGLGLLPGRALAVKPTLIGGSWTVSSSSAASPRMARAKRLKSGTTTG
jgi:hypothetical protein